MSIFYQLSTANIVVTPLISQESGSRSAGPAELSSTSITGISVCRGPRSGSWMPSSISSATDRPCTSIVPAICRAFERMLQVVGVHDQRPATSLRRRRQRVGHALAVGVQQDQERVVHDAARPCSSTCSRVPPLNMTREAAHPAGVPLLLRHLLAVGAIPGNVFRGGMIDLAVLEKLAPAQVGMGSAELRSAGG